MQLGGGAALGCKRWGLNGEIDKSRSSQGLCQGAHWLLMLPTLPLCLTQRASPWSHPKVPQKKKTKSERGFARKLLYGQPKPQFTRIHNVVWVTPRHPGIKWKHFYCFQQRFSVLINENCSAASLNSLLVALRWLPAECWEKDMIIIQASEWQRMHGRILLVWHCGVIAQ